MPCPVGHSSRRRLEKHVQALPRPPPSPRRTQPRPGARYRVRTRPVLWRLVVSLFQAPKPRRPLPCGRRMQRWYNMSLQLVVAAARPLAKHPWRVRRLCRRPRPLKTRCPSMIVSCARGPKHNNVHSLISRRTRYDTTFASFCHPCPWRSSRHNPRH